MKSSTKNDKMKKNKSKKRKQHEEKQSHPQISEDRNIEKNDLAVSLASRLKRQRGTAATTPLPPEWSGVSSSTPKFLAPSDGDQFESCVKECYRGFAYEKPKALPSTIHESFSSSFEAIDNSGLFLYDVVQPGGKKLSLTFVTRTLVGEPGSTYKYLGLRLFSHPWCDIDKDGDGKVVVNQNSTNKRGTSLTEVGYSKQCARALIQIGLINEQLHKRTERLLKTEIAPGGKDNLVGSAQYSLTLINKMEPTAVKKDLKNDKIHGLGKTSVSWHKDSGLQDFSSIAVYHTLKDMGGRSLNDTDHETLPWKVALRVASTQTRTPALSVPLPSGTLYYLLDDFNHQHEHAVISGSDSLRYSSTHRVARDGAGTWQYIRDKCNKILSSEVCVAVLQSTDSNKKHTFSNFSNSSRRKQLGKEVRACQRLITELEFEWIRQWYIQGKKHARLHPYWNDPIKRMEESYHQLNQITSHINVLLEESSKTKSEIVSEDLFDITIEAVENRCNLRNAWEQRLKDSIFKTLEVEARPFQCSMIEIMDHVQPEDIRKWKSAYINIKEGGGGYVGKDTPGGKRKRKDKNSSLTKKEKKRVASNWERMKNKKL